MTETKMIIDENTAHKQLTIQLFYQACNYQQYNEEQTI